MTNGYDFPEEIDEYRQMPRDEKEKNEWISEH